MAKKLGLILLLFVLTALTACAAKNTDTAQIDANKVYIISQNGLQGAVKGDGTVLFKPVYTRLSVLTDVFTNEQKYIEIYKADAGPDRDQYGMPTDVKESNALYDLSGKQIRPYLQDVFYTVPFGDYIMVNVGNDGYFVNVKTNREYYHGIAACADTKQTLLAYFAQTKQAILFDADLKPIKTFADVQSISFLERTEGYYEITNQAGMFGLINSQGKQVLPYQDTSYNSFTISPNCVLTDQNTKVIDLAGRTLMQAAPGYKISSYDGEAAVWQTVAKNDAERKQYLVDMDGKIISQAYDRLENSLFSIPSYTAGQAGQAPVYIGSIIDNPKYNKMISKTDVMDATGKILYAMEGENLWFVYAAPNCFIVSRWDTASSTNYAKAINPAGQDVIPERQNAYINVIYNQANQPVYLLENYLNSQGATLFAIYRLDGQPVLKDLNRFDYCDGQIVSGSKGFDSGIMDMQGHWLYKQSIFADLNADS